VLLSPDECDRHSHRDKFRAAKESASILPKVGRRSRKITTMAIVIASIVAKIDKLSFVIMGARSGRTSTTTPGTTRSIKIADMNAEKRRQPIGTSTRRTATAILALGSASIQRARRQT
jgi:hypothetical protein